MQTPISARYPATFFCSGDVTSLMPDGYKLTCIEEHYPVWPVDLHEGPFAICSYETGEQVLCPKHLIQHPPARAIGLGRAAAGIVCEECKAVYALSSILPSELVGKIACVCNFRDEKVLTVSVISR